MEGLMSCLTTTELAQKRGVSRKRVTTLCSEGRLDGAILKGKNWLVPDDIKKPRDLRKKNSI